MNAINQNRPEETDPVDAHIGNRLRLARLLRKWSQEKLGNTEDITFQQVQKYENGTNRLSASRLFRMAHQLYVPVSWFFDGLTPSKDRPDSADMDFLDEPETMELISTYYGIADKRQRKAVMYLLRSLNGKNKNTRHTNS